MVVLMVIQAKSEVIRAKGPKPNRLKSLEMLICTFFSVYGYFPLALHLGKDY